MNIKKMRIAIIGVGLIGGSIALAMKNRLKDNVIISGLCQSKQRTRDALQKGIIDDIFSFDKKEKYDFIILATPIGETLLLLGQLAPSNIQDAIVIDCGGTKVAICQKAQEKHSDSFIGTHPMAGSEVSGFEGASPFLFVNKPWIICPLKKTNPKNIKKVQELIKITGAIPTLLTPEVHDKDVTWASHIHLILASILLETVKTNSDWKMIEKIASTGFRDTTRLASHSPNIKVDIAVTNSENIQKSLVLFQKSLTDFLTMLKKQNQTEMLTYFNNSKEIRDEWIKNHFH